MHSTRIPLVCLLLAVAALALGACAVGADTHAEKPAAPARVTLQRTACFGICPAYTVTLSPGGDVSFVGDAHVQTQRAKGQATPAQTSAVMEAVTQSGFHAMRDSYTSREDGCEMMMSDQPSVKITVADAAGSKTVDFYKGCKGAAAEAVKPKMEQLATVIDRQLDTAQWIGKPAAAEHGSR
ncbi:MAG: DUF6438 domain-containing protein [Rhodanobacter sp.]